VKNEKVNATKLSFSHLKIIFMIFITEKQKGRQAFGLEDSVKIYSI